MLEPLIMVVLGTGEKEYEYLFRRLAQQYPSKFGLKVAYDNALAHLVEAGSDMFLMPSRYEPCGLNQIYSLRYGTVPIVRATGGLDDTVEAFDPKTGDGTGFKFTEYHGTALLETVKDAIEVFQNRSAWEKLMRNGMAKDYSWTASARDYVKVFEKAKQLR
jgi:starch synthase